MKKVIICIALIVVVCGIGLGYYKFHPHKYNLVDSKEPTCTEQGSKTYKCWCGNSYTDSIDPTGHEYEETITEPTCIEKGLKTYTCKKCGDVYTEEIEETGHNYQKEIREPSCVEDGVKTYTCINCGDIYTEKIDKLGHDYKEGICSRCGEKDPLYVEPISDNKGSQDNKKSTEGKKESSTPSSQPQTPKENPQAENSAPNVESYIPTDNSAETGAAAWGVSTTGGSWNDFVGSADTSNPYGLGVE